ncbi:MAG: AAA family ATPase [Polyangiaceae bacterium]|nr:AAA family ATPase [Polyangiaceae bacterium]
MAAAVNYLRGGSLARSDEVPAVELLPDPRPHYSHSRVDDMAKLRELEALFRALSAQDLGRARSVAVGIVEAEERTGHRSAARSLRSALGPNSHGFGDGGAVLLGLDAALTPLPTGRPLGSVVLRPSVRRELEALVLEWKHRAQLADLGLRRRTRVLVHGPPGCGKSLTARALATELGLPAFVVRFDAVVGAYLGQTAVRLRQLFQFAASTQCVLLFDEIDALGKRRGDPSDVGELSRVVIAMLQELEHTEPAGLLVAASNVAPQLDEALWRRFDLALEFPAPSSRAVQVFAAKACRTRSIAFGKALRDGVARARSFAGAERLVEDAARKAALAHVGRT